MVIYATENFIVLHFNAASIIHQQKKEKKDGKKLNNSRAIAVRDDIQSQKGFYILNP